jgi:hypothetical protein
MLFQGLMAGLKRSRAWAAMMMGLAGVAGCAMERSNDAAGTVAQEVETSEGDPGEGGEEPSTPEPPVPDEVWATLTEVNDALAASIVAFDEASAAQACAVDTTTCSAGEPGPGGESGPGGEPGPIGEPSPVGEPSLVNEPAPVIDFEGEGGLGLACGSIAATAAQRAGLLAALAAIDAQIPAARTARDKAAVKLAKAVARGWEKDYITEARIELVKAEARLATLELQKTKLIPAQLALLDDPCNVGKQRAVALAQRDIAKVNHDAAEKVRGHLAEMLRRKMNRHVPEEDRDKVREKLATAEATLVAAKAALDAAEAVLAALPANP